MGASASMLRLRVPIRRSGRRAVTKILIVEDNEMNRDMLSRRLMRKGFDVEIAVDGQAGVDMAISTSPDVVLMDLNLPVIDGWEATRRLKADPATQKIPVIALTAHAMQGDAQKALAVGCDDYDTKPVNFKRLLEKIEHLIDGA
jgi:CheY-like chemotaxis protein